MSKQKSNEISCPNCTRSFPSNRSISSHLQTCQTIRINEQLKIAATELKNPSIQQKSANRTQKTSMLSLTEPATMNTHSTEYVFPEDPNISMDATEHSADEPNSTHGSSIKDIKYEGLLTLSVLYQAHMEYKIRGHREVDLYLSVEVISHLLT